MKMRNVLTAGCLIALGSVWIGAAATAPPTSTLREVYRNNNFQPTGVAVARSGRLFLNYPRWSDLYKNAVTEVLPNGTEKPYPDAEWNRWDMKAETAMHHFVCVQSVVADGKGSLWVVDAGAPLLATTVPQGPKLVRIDLATNRIVQIIPFAAPVVTADSYLNDVRIDDVRQVAYLTDSGIGGIVTVDLRSGRAHRSLDGDPSVLPEPGVEVAVDGKTLRQNGKPPQFHSDGIALSHDGSELYYKAITSRHLYRIATSVLRDEQLPATQVAAAVQNLGYAPPADGLWMNERDQLFLTDPTHDAVSERLADGSYRYVVRDARLQWPDTMSEDASGMLYVTTSRINQGPMFNEGYSRRTGPYQLFRFKPN